MMIFYSQFYAHDVWRINRSRKNLYRSNWGVFAYLQIERNAVSTHGQLRIFTNAQIKQIIAVLFLEIVDKLYIFLFLR